MASRGEGEQLEKIPKIWKILGAHIGPAKIDQAPIRQNFGDQIQVGPTLQKATTTWICMLE